MRILLLALALFAIPAVALAEHPVHDGKWEVTTTMNMPGMAMPPQVHTQCITRKNPVPKHESSHAQNCTNSEPKIEGNKVSWDVTCESPHGTSHATGAVTYAKDTFDGAMVMKMNNPRSGQPMEVTVTMSGKRLGECDAN